MHSIDAGFRRRPHEKKEKNRARDELVHTRPLNSMFNMNDVWIILIYEQPQISWSIQMCYVHMNH